MGKPTGFLEYERKNSTIIEPLDRINNFNEFHHTLPKEERLKQASRCMDCGVPFCQSGMTLGGMTSGCPLNNLIPEWNDMLYKGNLKEAYLRLIMTNNFPEFTARVCPALCEAACTLGLNNDSVSSKENALSIIESAYENGLAKATPPKNRTDKKIAIIGSGPSGLAAADQLNKRGHNITVFERSNRLGGLLMNGIPNMKLDKNIVNRKLKVMEAEGITFVTSVNVGKSKKSINTLSDYDAVILACGATKPRDINVLGREGESIYFAVDFLTDVTDKLISGNLDTKNNIIKDKNVIIIGGGDTGNDCVGTSIRLGAKSIVQLEMMPRPPEKRCGDNPWPEWPKVLKTDYGQEEAIAVWGSDPRVFNTTVKEFLRNDQSVLTGVKTVRLDSNMKPLEDSEIVLDANVVLIAAGFLGPEEYLLRTLDIKISKDDYSTNISNIYATGDMRIGQSIVVKAIDEGRKVATIVDKNLMGYTNL
ncbi:MAG: glutamate synthase subunit beta [Peptostreptococcaceae bacterium]|nr:glutamate synthase subunit beta [Peptostreptococcaceae bacterium]